MKRREVIKVGAVAVLSFLGGLSSGYRLTWPAKEKLKRTEREEIENKCFVEVHDVAPWVHNLGYLQELDDILEEMKVKREYFLIPSNKDDRNILEHSHGFVDYLKQKIIGKYPLGHHGLLHWPMDDKKQLYEFSYLSREEARAKCEEAMRIHKNVFGCLPDGGEVPPNWSYSTEALKVFLEFYPYVCTYNFVFWRSRLPLIAEAFMPTWEIRDYKTSVKRFKYGLEYYKPSVVRVVIHPQDTKSKDFMETVRQVFNLIESKGYGMNTYKELSLG